MNSPSRALLGVMVVVLIGVAASTGYLAGRYLPSSGVSTQTTTVTLTATTGTTYLSTRTTTPTFPVECSGLQRVGNPGRSGFFFMNLTSTACMVVTYRAERADVVVPGVRIVRWSCYLNSTGSGCSLAKDYTSSFITAYAPSSVNLTELEGSPAFSINSTLRVMYLLRPLANATGFYDMDFQAAGLCGEGNFALAVGYPPSQVNGSDFSNVVVLVPSHCFIPPSFVLSVSIANMGYESAVIPPPS